MIAGGVSANKLLRQELQSLEDKGLLKCYLPQLKYCTDNGAMIALAGAMRLKQTQMKNSSIRAYPRWSLEELSPP